MDPELKQLLDKAREAIGSTAELQTAIDEIKAWGAEKGRLAEAEKAVTEVKDQVEQMTANFEARVAAMARRVYDQNGRYRGRCFGSEDQARTFGLSVLANIAAHSRRAAEILETDHKDFVQRAGTAHDGEGGLIRHEHSSRIERLVEEYGHARRLFRVQPVSEVSGTWHTRKSGLRARKTKVRAAVEEQTAGWGVRNWSCDDFDILVTYPMSMNADMIVSFAELLAEELALGFAIAEDEDMFIGDGSDDYDNIVGAVNRLKNINGVDDGGGLTLASGNAWSEIAEADIDEMIGDARYVRPGMGKLACSNEFFWQVLQRIAGAKGGVTRNEAEASPRFLYKGVDVEIVPVMPRVEGNSQVPLLYGDFNLAGTVYSRQEMIIRESREAFFTSKEIGLMATERVDIDVHTIGDATTPGPLVGLITAAS